MINADLGHVVDLRQFNEEINAFEFDYQYHFNTQAHGDNYCDIHDAIRKYMPECKSYVELGTHQGGTASTAMLCNPSKITLVDIDFSRYRKFLAPIAQKYCQENNIQLNIIEKDSSSIGTASLTDMLVIDSLHQPSHMKKELSMHGFNTRKYIIAHDTSIVNGMANESLFICLREYADSNGWVVVERGTENVGYTVLKRV